MGGGGGGGDGARAAHAALLEPQHQPTSQLPRMLSHACHADQPMGSCRDPRFRVRMGSKAVCTGRAWLSQTSSTQRAQACAAGWRELQDSEPCFPPRLPREAMTCRTCVAQVGLLFWKFGGEHEPLQLLAIWARCTRVTEAASNIVVS